MHMTCLKGSAGKRIDQIGGKLELSVCMDILSATREIFSLGMKYSSRLTYKNTVMIDRRAWLHMFTVVALYIAVDVLIIA